MDILTEENTAADSLPAEDTPQAEEAGSAPSPEESGEKERALSKNGGIALGGGNVLAAIGGFFRRHWIYIPVFFVPALVLFGAYAAFGVHPFGDMSVLVLDLNGQFVYYFEHLRDVLHGEGSFFISWSRNLTGETMGMFAYYLASPFTLIPMILPRSMMTESLLIMQMCKIGAASCTFFFYLRHSRDCRTSTAFIFAVMYSLQAYMIEQLMNPMWLDGLVYLPLIIYGIENIIDRRKVLGFVIPLALLYTANFYIGWMVTFFAIMYFLYYYFAGKRDYTFGFRSFFGSGVRFALGGVLAAGAAAWVLLPLYYSLKLGKFEFTTPDYTLSTKFEFLDFFKNLLPSSYDTCRPEGAPVVYCGVLTIMTMPLFFLNSKVRFRQKMGLGALALALILSMYLSTVDLAWHGMQLPNWLNHRYSFMLCFVLLIMGALTLERLTGLTVKEVGLTALGLAVYALYVNTKGYDGVDLVLTVWYTVIFTAVYGILLRFIRLSGVKARKVLTYVLGVVITGEMFGSALALMFKINKDVVYSKYSSYNRYITLGRKTVDMLYDMDPFEKSGVYRVEKDYHRTVNDPLALGNFGISHSSSTLNAAPIQFLRRLGFSYGGHYIKYKGATYISDAILGIKYVMEKGSYEDDNIPESKSYDRLVFTTEDEKDVWAVYENPYALPVAFMADETIADVTLGLDNPFENQNRILSHLVGNEEKAYFKRVDGVITEPSNAKLSSYGAHTKYTPVEEGKNSQVEFKFDVPTSDMLYFYMPSSYERKVNLWLNKEFVDYYFEGGNMAVKTLGRFTPGEEISFICTITEDGRNELLFKDKLFYYLDEQLFREDIQKLADNGLEMTSFAEDHITGTIDADKDGIMFTSISWEPGWTILVDGEKVEPVKICDALIGVPMSAGHHDIEMKFFPAGLKNGLIISGCSIAIIILIAAGSRRQAGRGKKQEAAAEK